MRKQLRKVAKAKEEKDEDILLRKLLGIKKNEAITDVIYEKDEEILKVAKIKENEIFQYAYEFATRAVTDWKKQVILSLALDENNGVISTEVIRKKLDELIQWGN